MSVSRWGALLLLLLSSSLAHAQGTPGTNAPASSSAPAVCGAKDVFVTDLVDGTLRLGEKLVLELRGTCRQRLEEVLTNEAVSQKVTLFLNQVAMTKLPVYVENAGDTVKLYFDLRRDSRNADDRTTWDRFLGQETDADFDVRTISLGVATDLPVVAQMAESREGQDPQPIKLVFGVADHQTIVRTAVVSLIALALVWLILLMHPSALKDPAGRYSLAKSQLVFWGLLVFAAFCGLWSITRTMEWIPDQMLTLLGISATTGLISASIDGQKQANVTSARVWSRPRIFTFLSDIMSDGNGLCFHRIQAALWTAVLGAIFVRSVIAQMSMPTFDNSLLWLMGVTSGTFLGLKGPEKAKEEAS